MGKKEWNKMDITKLKLQLQYPFPEKDIEWRLSRSGCTNNRVWARCLAYVTARAVQDRLDNVMGINGWKADYTPLGANFLCNLSLKFGDEWITKVDGSEATDFEPFKGGISGALKRAGVIWGVGRYLYHLEENFAQIVDKGTPGAMSGKYRSKQTNKDEWFNWVPPQLPEWALPRKKKEESK